MEKDISDLKKLMSSKIENTLFEEELDKLKNLINSLAGKELKTPLIQTGPSLSSKEISDFKDALKKIGEHEEKINKLTNDVKGINIESIIKRLN